MELWPEKQPKSYIGRAIFIHGAGAPSDSQWMNEVSDVLQHCGWWVWRAEFAYMAQRRHGLPKRPPPKTAQLVSELDQAVQPLNSELTLLVGKSMGGRIASHWLAEAAVPRSVVGALVLGYPFHPLGRPDRPRTEHLSQLQKPVEIIQGTHDPMGSFDWVTANPLPQNLTVFWQTGGGHDLNVARRWTAEDSVPKETLIHQRAVAWAQRVPVL